ncbi:uncharacterized protein LOC133385663 [Rhineura floridana]|uniref:uncharacterized protein LOC133385663 n=1 Tax=Rhineura floridana TaxID=261503 RepID=UPI002AC842BF|nr:uncharacterized protein LOC133385663 [Rhineura floridana]
MWETDYVGSLAPLQDALTKICPSTQLGRVSAIKDYVVEMNVSEAAEVVVAKVSVLLGNLKEDGFFLLLSDLPTIARELRAVWTLLSSQCKVPRIVSRSERTLAPVSCLLFHLAPKKVHDVLSHLKDFVDDASNDWDEDSNLEYLMRVQQDLEEVQPNNTLDYLRQLHELLMSQHQELTRLACHPSIKENLGMPNVFHKLLSLWEALGSMLDDSSHCLTNLQGFLAALDKMQACLFYRVT